MNKLEESVLIENFIDFCEQENIDIESLTEEQIDEIFGFIKKGISKTADAMSRGAEQGWNKNVQAGHTGLSGLGRKVGGAIKGMTKEAGKGFLSGLKGGADRQRTQAASQGQMDRMRQQRADRARASAAAYAYKTKGQMPNFKGSTSTISGKDASGEDYKYNVPSSIAKEVKFRKDRGYSQYGDSTELFGNKIVERFSVLLEMCGYKKSRKGSSKKK